MMTVATSLSATTSSRPSAFPRNGSLEIPTGYAPQPLDRPFIAVAYYLLTNSRLGCSSDTGYDDAYHTTFCKSRVNTNHSSGKKFTRLPAFHLAAKMG